MGVLFASTDIVVPDDARVVQTGTTIVGSVDYEAACDGTGTREVVVDVSEAFGSIDVRTRSEAAAEQAADPGDRDGATGATTEFPPARAPLRCRARAA